MQLTTQQQGWLHLADIKRNLFEELQNAELAVQGKLNALPTDLESVQTAIKESKQIMTDAKNKRLAFSRMIDEKLLAPSMLFEKRMAEIIEAAGKHELELRKEAEKAAQEAQAYQSEVAAYKAHIINEWYRIATQYRQKLNDAINVSYIALLNNKIPSDKIKKDIEDIKRLLSTFTLPKPTKFNRTLITDTQAREIVAEIRQYDPAIDLQNAINSVDEKFSMYAHDLQNAESAAAAIQEQAAKDAAEQAQKLAAEQATNLLIAQAETVLIDTPKVKRELKIVVYESEQWAMTIIGNFLKNWQHVNKYVRVKSWAKLTISQMADALAKHISETGEMINGLETEEICK